ncbi:MAG: hypothetical protein J0I07_11845 [Myxococcales bacterium]|nr:hypothetical protein [Myxococcales bacterium]
MMAWRMGVYVVVVTRGNVRRAVLRTNSDLDAYSALTELRCRGERVTLLRASSADDYEVIEDDA